MEILAETLFRLAIVIAIFLVLSLIGDFIRGKLKGKIVNVNELLPEDEVHTLRQVFYLILMALCIVNIFYHLAGAEKDIYYLVIFDILLSLYFAITLDKSSVKNKIALMLLIPYGSLYFSFFNGNLMDVTSFVFILDIIHILIFAFMAKLNFDKFMEYTNSNGLGITIIILFVIIFAGFFIAQYTEDVNALDALVIVSNEFTGNGYSVFGASLLGKLNSLLLVWGGYVISGAGAATLTAALLIKQFKKKFEELEKLIEGDDE